ncbi:MAG: alkaline phosphatase family protein [Bacilli bacterium]|nr:alkaline phosphatase family protein [Bacilli bacterium]
MKVKNNYNECLTNLACSIRKYFGLEYKHNTLSYIDEILEKKQPRNVILFLFDGMGSNILDRNLDKDAFFIKNRYKKITTVFPATTTAATTAIRTGLNPCEHGWIGWNVYLEPIDKIITLYMNREKGKEETYREYFTVKDQLVNDTIADEINRKGEYKGLELFPFKAGNAKVYRDLDEMYTMINYALKEDGKHFIYAYNDEPDHTMHDFGPDSEEAKRLIETRNRKTEEFCKNLEDTLVIVVADHGHIKVDHIFLKDYPEIMEMMERTTSIEQRAASFKIKEEYMEEFPVLFNKLFGKSFTLYTKKDVMESKLFGDGEPNKLFEPALGDFIAIAENDNKCLVTDGDEVLVSQHAGYTDDEVYIPLIIVDKCLHNK